MPADTRTTTKHAGAVIMEDRPCVRCGYNLVGLDADGTCPECGTTITRRRTKGRFNDTLVNAEPAYLRQLAVALGAMAAVVVGTWALWIGSWAGSIPPVVGGVVAVVLAVAWVAATWAATRPRPHTDRTVRDDILDNDRLRTIARVAQGVGLAAVLAETAHTLTGLVAFGVVSGLLTVGALFGLVPLGIYLSSLADWASETGVGARLRASAWCITVCGTLLILVTLLLLMPVPFRLLLAAAMTVLSIIVLMGLVLFCASTVQLANTAVWAIVNARQTQEREIRLAERKRRQAEEAAARAATAHDAMAVVANPHHESLPEDDTPIPVDGHDSGDEPAAGARHAPSHRPRPADHASTTERRQAPAERDKDFDPYDLVDDD